MQDSVDLIKMPLIQAILAILDSIISEINIHKVLMDNQHLTQVLELEPNKTVLPITEVLTHMILQTTQTAIMVTKVVLVVQDMITVAVVDVMLEVTIMAAMEVAMEMAMVLIMVVVAVNLYFKIIQQNKITFY